MTIRDCCDCSYHKDHVSSYSSDLGFHKSYEHFYMCVHQHVILNQHKGCDQLERKLGVKRGLVSEHLDRSSNQVRSGCCH